MRNRALLAIASLVLLVSCVSSQHVLVGKQRPAVDVAQVKLYVSPPSKYEEIAFISAAVVSPWPLDPQARVDAEVKQFKKEAAKLGANGVLLPTNKIERVLAIYVEESPRR